jgi:hypothetical protein
MSSLLGALYPGAVRYVIHIDYTSNAIFCNAGCILIKH